MAKYRKKPVVIEAEQWAPYKTSNHLEQAKLQPIDSDSDWVCKECGNRASLHANCPTLEGWHIVCPGDYIIKGVKGEFYPCKPDIFEMTYEHVADSNDYNVPLRLIQNEYIRARKIHAPMATAHHGIAIIEEEFIELRNEVFKRESLRDMEAMKEEAVQLGAMALRFLIDICRVGA